MPYPAVIYSVHASERLIGRGVTRAEVEAVLESGERIEDYPDDPRGASYLMLGFSEAGASEPSGNSPLHVVAADDDAAKETTVVTLYEPDPQKWSGDFRTRK